MPYSWKTDKWRWILHRTKINPPLASGLHSRLEDESHNVFAWPELRKVLGPGVPPLSHELLGDVGQEQICRLLSLYNKACEEEKSNRCLPVMRVKATIDELIRQMSSSDGACNDPCKDSIEDLQALWYVLSDVTNWRTHLRFDRTKMIETFITEYWGVLLPSLKKHLVGNTSLLRQLITYPGIGVVQPHIFFPVDSACVRELEAKGIETDLDVFFTEVSLQMGTSNSTLIFSTCQVGSMGEGSKIGYCDEFDYRIKFDKIQLPLDRKNSPAILKIRRMCDEVSPPLTDIHTTYMSTVNALCNTKITERLEFLACGDEKVPVPWLLFRWTPDTEVPHNWSLVKVDTALTIPCLGVWPGDKTMDPIGRPIKQLCHIMLPRPGGDHFSSEDKKNKEFRWSVCDSQQQFFRTLPKYVQLGYVISKIICSNVFYPDCSTSPKPPSSFRLKNVLFNAIANKDIQIQANDDNEGENDLILQAITVSDVIIAGLNHAGFGYFYEGEPVEHITDHYNSFLACSVLHKLVKDHLQLDTSISDTVSEEILIPLTMKRLNGELMACSDLEMARKTLGLRKEKISDNWSKVAHEAASKWVHRIPDGVKWAWKFAEDHDVERCMENLEGLRVTIAKCELRIAEQYVDMKECHSDLEDIGNIDRNETKDTDANESVSTIDDIRQLDRNTTKDTDAKASHSAFADTRQVDKRVAPKDTDATESESESDFVDTRHLAGTPEQKKCTWNQDDMDLVIHEKACTSDDVSEHDKADKEQVKASFDITYTEHECKYNENHRDIAIDLEPSDSKSYIAHNASDMQPGLNAMGAVGISNVQGTTPYVDTGNTSHRDVDHVQGAHDISSYSTEEIESWWREAEDYSPMFDDYGDPVDESRVVFQTLRQGLHLTRAEDAPLVCCDCLPKNHCSFQSLGQGYLACISALTAMVDEFALVLRLGAKSPEEDEQRMAELRCRYGFPLMVARIDNIILRNMLSSGRIVDLKLLDESDQDCDALRSELAYLQKNNDKYINIQCKIDFE